MFSVCCIILQNQFFISSLPDEGVENTVVDYIRSKIVDAHKNKKTFQVIVYILLLPEFEGTYLHVSPYLCSVCNIAKSGMFLGRGYFAPAEDGP